MNEFYQGQKQKYFDAENALFMAQISYNKYIVGICSGLMVLMSTLHVDEQAMHWLQLSMSIVGLLCVFCGVISVYAEIVVRKGDAKFQREVLAGIRPPSDGEVNYAVFFYLSVLSIVLFGLFVLGLASYLIFPLVS